MMLLLPRLRDKCLAFLRRRVQSTSTQATQRPFCTDTGFNACLLSSIGNMFVILAVTYAAHSPHWIVMDAESPGSDEVRAPDMHVTVEAASPKQTADVRGSSDVRASGIVVSSNMSGSVVEDGRSRCTTDHSYIGSYTICAIYDTKLYCGKTTRPTSLCNCNSVIYFVNLILVTPFSDLPYLHVLVYRFHSHSSHHQSLLHSLTSKLKPTVSQILPIMHCCCPPDCFLTDRIFLYQLVFSSFFVNFLFCFMRQIKIASHQFSSAPYAFRIFL